jgi:hypothetical protein|tara:strand:+ start:96 stop:500 length:405 start_codon:yes stop_codon:yes gene_type:complete
MAETKTVLINDGGAPARIMNFTAAAAISAGECLKIDGNGKAALSTDPSLPAAGFALVDAAADDLVSVITGSGIVINAITKAVTAGQSLVPIAATAGCLDDSTGGGSSGDDADVYVAIALETTTAVGELTRVLVV